ncbi:peptidoglycan DD-metalloendopeptidase family protein [Helicobacter saguini]|uniref:M23 family metallopeptidase n=2 Tax=Helicobacter saguini TaxID=1548018 RepID=A0A347VZ95_9HELI|nr:peptidoglycan DD-metalloendopeptidase family protein [Helicobacter saguini]MWV68433.1 peptidoglycan DD-metalloendopeptidase family protein [Helicobacter saguini]MWV70103.1 peptidoglycan DD-metalloendopeptidase family protein [Helicobacter saguini]MWV72006.1 peptidoglycan DD-metalloendopeptidase family protein [Helicobacter saguini]TLD93777.1 M23 family metallopeptidase [Helicobacter saguini]
MPFCIVFLLIMYYLLNSQSFERINPALKLYLLKDKNIYPFESSYFNPENDIKLSAFDASGLSSYNVEILDSNGKILLESSEILTKKSKKIDVILPKISNLKNGDSITYKISVQDWSNTNFFRGNTTTISKNLVINNTTPQIQIIATSQQISYGGAALIAFQARDLGVDNSDLGVERVFLSNGKNIFEAYPYINKQGYLVYLSIIAWPITNTFFEGKIHVFDKASNEKVITIPIATNINFTKRLYNFPLSDSYMNKMLSRLEQYVKFPISLTKDIEKFEYFNKIMRPQDNKRIGDFDRIFINDAIKKIPRFNTFAPLQNYTIQGKFGDEYIYRYKGENIGSFKRLGIDLVASKNTSIISSNDARLAFSGQIGEYGNVVVLGHNLGLNTMYGYLNNFSNTKYSLNSLDVIGYVGHSGLALIDNVRFSVLVQGHFVNPQEWMNAEWIDKNINQVLEKAENFGIR